MLKFFNKSGRIYDKFIYFEMDSREGGFWGYVNGVQKTSSVHKVMPLLSSGYKALFKNNYQKKVIMRLSLDWKSDGLSEALRAASNK